MSQAAVLHPERSGLGESKAGSSPGNDAKSEPLIRRLELPSSIPLAEMKAFYHQLLGLRMRDEHGLLLVMKRGRVISFDAPERKAVNIFPTTAVVGGDRRAKYALPEFPYEVSIEE